MIPLASLDLKVDLIEINETRLFMPDFTEELTILVRVKKAKKNIIKILR